MLKFIKTNNNYIIYNKLYYLNKNIGEARIGIINDTGVLYNIWIDYKYRNKGYGSCLLYNTEFYMKDKKLFNFSLSVLQKPQDNLTNFFFKNGFNLKKKEIDSSINIFYFEKYL